MATKNIATNRRARFNYEITDTYEAGIVLLGSEVKSLRAGQADLKDSYASVRGGEMWLVGMRISPYEYARDGGASFSSTSAKSTRSAPCLPKRVYRCSLCASTSRTAR